MNSATTSTRLAARARANCSTAATSANRHLRRRLLRRQPLLNGVDLNGDGDTLDTVTVLAPSQTHTRRYGVIAGLRYEINDDHTVRVTYTYDRSNHRQTGEVGCVDANGEPFDVFPVNDPLADATGRRPAEARPPVLRDPRPGLGRVSRRLRHR